MGRPVHLAGETVDIYRCADDLFDQLTVRAKADTLGLADTLVILDIGASCEDTFRSVANSQTNDCWHHAERNRAGIATELILRFPQVFPVLLTTALPVEDSSQSEVGGTRIGDGTTARQEPEKEPATSAEDVGKEL